MVTLNLPWELESEILSRVPPTSAKQLRLTCKRWYALFKDHIFIKNHLGKAATQMILKNGGSVYSFSFNFHGIHNQVEFTGKLKSLKDSEDVTICKIVHCDGLLLCTTKGHRLVVWNPCTGQTRWIPSRPSSSDYTTYYFGYENKNKSCDNYKILSRSYYRSSIRDVEYYEIYELNSDSWRVLDAISDDRLYIWHGLATSLNGDTYWLDSETTENSSIRFDFTTEKFERLSLPPSSDENNRPVVLSTVREEKLALLCQYSDSTGSLKMKIWVTDTKTDEAKDLSWSEFLVVDVVKLMRYGAPKVKSFLVDEENKKVLCCYTDDEYRTRIYIVGEDTLEAVCREVPKGPQLRASLRLFSYVPSLVQIP